MRDVNRETETTSADEFVQNVFSEVDSSSSKREKDKEH